jgi:hypothetical protein
MKMAKASEADLNMAMELTGALDSLTGHWPALPPGLCSADDDDANDRFDCDDDRQCGTVLRHLLAIAGSANLMRVVFGCAVMLDPRNQCVDPTADTIEHHADTKAGQAAKQPRPLCEWHQDAGPALWWAFPVNEPPWCGQPSDDDWPQYHTHWTPLVVPEAPAVAV